MKIRFLNNSIRFRLNQSEIKNLTEGNRVRAKTKLGPGDDDYILYELAPMEEARGDQSTQLEWIKNHLIIHMVPCEIQKWCDPSFVTIKADLDLGPEGSLKLVFEKDFKCLVPRPGEDDLDTFAHPEKGPC